MNSLLSDRVLSMKESATLRMSRLAWDLQAQGIEVINLSLGEPDFDTPDFIKEAAWQALRDGYTKYTPVPGLPALREAISQKFLKENQLNFAVDQIVVSNGAKQTISNLAMALLNPGDEAVLLTPYWVSYHDISNLAGGHVKPVLSGVEQDFKVKPDQLDAALTEKTKFVLFSSPCNPSGSVYSMEELEGLAEVLRRYPHVVVISDEIYEYINFVGPHVSIAQCAGLEDRVVVVNGFSKGFAMTGWRLGYMGGPKWLAAACSKIQSQCTSGAASFSQKAAVAALQGDHTASLAMCQTYLRRKNLVRDRLNTMKGVVANDPQGAFYIFPNISAYLGAEWKGSIISSSDDLCEYLLSQAHIAVVSGEAFGEPECIRISFAAADDDLKAALDRMEEVLYKLTKA